MLRRLIAIVAIVLGLAMMAAAVGSATIWRPDDQVSATLPTQPEETVVVSAPGVLNMVDDEVQVRLIGADEDTPLVLAMAREADLRAWLGTAPYLEITGLRSWEELEISQEQEAAQEPDQEDADEDGTQDEATDEEATEDDADEGEQADAETLPNPSGSDLWVEELTDSGELSYTWNAVPGRWMMLAATDGTEPAPQVELTWTRQVPTPLLVPGLIIGGVIFLAGAAGLVLFALMDRERNRARRARQEQALAEAEVPQRRPGRHRGAQSPAPVDDLLSGSGAATTADDESLSYAERLGWPGAGTDGAPDAQIPDSDAQRAEEAAAPSAEVPRSPAAEGVPLTRRQIREAEAARLAEERSSRRKKRRRPGAEDRAEGAGGAGGAEATEQNPGQGAAGDLAGGSDSGQDSHSADRAATAPEQEADGSAPQAGAQDAGSSAPELSDWIASGRSGEQAGPIRTYPVDAPGAGPPAAQDAGSVPSPDSMAPTQEEKTAGPSSSPWWRPWQRRRDDQDAPRRRRPWRRETAPDPQAQGEDQRQSSDSESAGADDAHASGALWRRTWGIEPPTAQPSDTEPSDEPDPDQDSQEGER